MVLRAAQCFCLSLLMVVSAFAERAFAADLSLSVEGPEEAVFVWEKDRCEQRDIPDAPARALRTTQGVQLLASHYVAFRSIGPNLLNTSRSCDPVFRSNGDADPARFDDRTWLTSLWSRDGQEIFALAHHEYQGHRHPGRCQFKEYRKCWVNSILALKSSDGGKTYQKIDNYLAFSADQKTESVAGVPRGYFQPSNMIEKDGHLYSLIYKTGLPDQEAGVCLARTPSNSFGSEWAYWTDSGWLEPAKQFQPSEAKPCRKLKNLYESTSFLYHAKSQNFLSVTFMPGGPLKGKLAFSTSKDMINWSAPKEVVGFPMTGYAKCPIPPYGYPTLIDENAPDRSFTTIGDRPILFVTRFNSVFKRNDCRGDLNRDLSAFRVRIEQTM